MKAIGKLSFLLLLNACNQPATKEITSKKATSDSVNFTMSTLPSWNEGKTKTAIIDFVTKVTKAGSTDFIPEADRIACFDNDGCLWSEQPMYFQFAYAFDKVKTMASAHPEWKNKQPFQALMDGDMKTVMAGGEKSISAILKVTHSGMSQEEYHLSVKQWMDTATHPKTGKHYNEMIYQPMTELLQYLRSNGFKTFIVSGGGIDFMRAWAEDAYGIPPYQIVGSSGGYAYDAKDSNAIRVLKLPEINFNDDKEGKPVGIVRHIGKRPVFTAGNSDGDYAMLQYTSAGTRPSFGLIVHHTDSIREVAYDRNSSIGRLSKGLDDAAKYHWQIVDMRTDWKKVFAFEK